MFRMGEFYKETDDLLEEFKISKYEIISLKLGRLIDTVVALMSSSSTQNSV